MNSTNITASSNEHPVFLLEGCFALPGHRIADNRGSFAKVLSAPADGQIEPFKTAEYFFSWSHRNVLRGMHLQMADAMAEKLVCCLVGTILDVVVDLRAGTDFGKVTAIELTQERPVSVFIPKGVAHGFLSLTDSTLVSYLTSHVYVPRLDGGVHWKSIPFNWPISKPHISARDAALPPLSQFAPLNVGMR